MKDYITKAKTYKAIALKNDDVHLSFNTLVDERLTKIFGEVSCAPAMIVQEWMCLKDALAQQRAKHTIMDRMMTPQIDEALKRRDDLLDNIIRMTEAWSKDPVDREINFMGRLMILYLKRLRLLKGGYDPARDIPTGIFCRWTLEMPEYIAAVQSGKIKPVVEELKQINDKCRKMLQDRFFQLYTEIPMDMKELRKQTDAAYRELINKINEAIVELTLLAKEDHNEQASQMDDIATVVEAKERLTRLISLLNSDVSHYQYQAAEARKNRK